MTSESKVQGKPEIVPHSQSLSEHSCAEAPEQGESQTGGHCDATSAYQGLD